MSTTGRPAAPSNRTPTMTNATTAIRRSRSNAATSGNNSAAPPRLSIPDEPPKVPRRPPSKGNKRETLADIAKRIPIQLMRKYFNYPLRSAAEAMHISVTTLKRLCRRHGVKRWPHRQISGINRALNDLEAQHEVASEGEVAAVADQLRQLHRRREVIIELAFESDDESSRKSITDGPAAAHKRGSASSDSSSSSCASSTDTSASRSRAGSLASSPPSPVTAFSTNPPMSPTSLGEGKPTSVWWQHTPVGDDTPAFLGDNRVGLDGGVIGGDGGSANRSRRKDTTRVGHAEHKYGARGSVGGASGRPRPSTSGSSRTKSPRAPRSSAMFGSIPRPGANNATATARHRRKSSSGDTAVISGSSGRRYSSTPPPTSKVTAATAPPRPAIGTSAGSAGAGIMPSCHQLSMTSSLAGNVFEQQMQLSQQMGDLTALGELLFGPDETAAAAESRGLGMMTAHPGIFSHNASQWAPCVPFCPPGVFSHESYLDGTSPVFTSHEHGF